MLENKEHRFKVEKLDKTWTICKRDGSEVKKITQPAVNVTFTCEVGYGHERSFLAYYGSMPCYEDDYAGFTDYDYEVDFDELSEWIFDDQEYYQDLYNRNRDLFYQFFSQDEDEEWIWEADEQSAYDLIMDAIEHKKDFLGDIQEKAQEAYDNEPEDVPDYD